MILTLIEQQTDPAVPTGQYCVSSNNALDSNLARAGDTISLTLATETDATLVSADCGDVSFVLPATVVGLSQYTLTYTVTAADTGADISACVVVMHDPAGNENSLDSTGSSACSMIIGLSFCEMSLFIPNPNLTV